MEGLNKPFPCVSQSVGKCLIYNKGIRTNDASKFDRWLMENINEPVKIWSNAALPIDHQNYEYTQAQ